MTKRPTRVPGDAPAPAPVVEAPADELPNVIDVDPAKIKAPTLTRQGWVLPLEQPRNLVKPF